MSLCQEQPDLPPGRARGNERAAFWNLSALSDEPTASSLLLGLRQNDPVQWDRFARVYSPLVYEWCRRAKVGEQDSADIAQETFIAVNKCISTFRRQRATDTFQGWLWGITRHKILDHFRHRAKQPVAVGGTDAQHRLNRLAAYLPESLDQDVVEQDTKLVVRRALDLLRTEFEDRTWRAFCGLVMENVDVKSVAAELDMTPGAVYNAKYKVLRRLREEFGEMMD